MPKKLTEEEQRAAIKLARALANALPAQHRSGASGIASGLVRLRMERIPTGKVQEVFNRYGAGRDALEAVAAAGLLADAGEDAYRIRIDGEPLAAQGEKDGAAHAGSGPADTGEKNAGAVKAGNRGGSAPAGSGNAPAKEPAAHSAPHASLPAAGKTSASRPEQNAAAPPAQPGALAKEPAASANPPRGPRRKPRPLGRASVIRKQTPELTEIRRRIIDLDPRLWINGYLLSTPDVFVDYEPELTALSAALDRRPAIGNGTLTMRELSYRIFGDEKFLAIESEGRKLLRFMGVADMVRCRTVHKTDLLNFIPRHRRRPRLVLSENLDPWTNMRDALFLGERKRILGKRVDGVVFGNGHLALGSRQLTDLASTLDAESVRVYYWGDLDRAGLEILAKVAQEAQPDAAVPLTVEPFAPAYRLMLKRAMKRFPDPLDNKPTDQTEDFEPGLALLEPLLKKKEAAYLRAALEGARLIPQEIITAADL